MNLGVLLLIGRSSGELPVEVAVDVELYEFDRTVGGGHLVDDREPPERAFPA
jgi:hypothetical protein